MGLTRRKLRALCPPGSLKNHAPPTGPGSVEAADPALTLLAPGLHLLLFGDAQLAQQLLLLL